ncbi:Sec-independent protein translocase subunit TatA [Sphaerisporangium sp. NPDC088356]|uniref:Sec-independent protein translocase subunit TatA n=1 Tax=Sphaerisporangium sp. NPDC088356 TaxID=3154871 RepID=UPI003418D3AC
MPSLGPMEWILILLVLVLLFGAKKLPDTAKALGQSLRLFKKETTKLHEEDEVRAAQSATATPQPAPAPQQSLPPVTPSVEDRLRVLEEENARLRNAQAAAAPKDQGSV